MIPLVYLLEYNAARREFTNIEATAFDENGTPKKWTIRRGSNCMSRFDGDFYWEPNPSSRDEEFFKEFRFDTAEEAEHCYNKFYKK